MTGDELKTNHLGLKLALGLLCPSVQLSLEAPGLPLSTAESSTSGVKPNLDTRCVPAEFAPEQQLMCVKDKDSAADINQKPFFFFFRQRCSLELFRFGGRLSHLLGGSRCTNEIKHKLN